MAESDIAYCGDSPTLQVSQKNLFDVQGKLESKSTKLFQWFHDNYLRANSSKSPP